MTCRSKALQSAHPRDNGQEKSEGGKMEGRWGWWDKDGASINIFSGIYKDGKKIAPLPKKK